MKQRRSFRGITGIVTLVGVVVVGVVMSVLRQPDPNATRIIDRQSTRTTVNGEKIFPIGMYHTSWSGSKAEMHEALEAIGAAGMNVMHPALSLRDQDFIDRAAELGVYLIVEPNDDEGVKAMLEGYQDEPNILAWDIADDFNAIDSPKTPAEIADERDLVQGIAAQHQTYISGNNRNLEQYTGLSNIIGIQTYSIPTDPLNLTYDMLTYTIETSAPSGASVYANLQTYAVQGRRVPTNDEIRNITYQSLIAGVDGILYYTYFDEVWDIEDYPAMWQGLTEISAEVRQLAPIILDGELTAIPSGNPSLLLGQWRYEGKRYLVVINWTEETLSNITLPVTATSITPFFENRPAGFGLENNTLTGSIGAAQVDVYILED